MTGSDDRTATDPNKVDAIKLSLMLADLRLPTINQLWKSFAKRADAEGWTAARFLAALAEHELAERDRRRIERHLREARLLPGKSFASFDFKAVPMLAKAQVMTEWLSSMLELAGTRERLLAEARASGEAVTDHPGHAAWRTQAVTTRAEGALMLVDKYRYGVHLDRVAGARAQLGEPFGEFGRALRFDRNAASLLSEWRARESGRGKMTPDDLASRIGALAAGAAPGEMPAELLSAAAEIAERQRQEEARRQREAEARTRQEAELRREEEARARDEETRRREEEEARARQEAEARQREEEARQLADRNAGELRAELGALAEERIRLVESAPSPDRLAGLEGWRDRAAPAVAGAIRMAGDPALNADVREALSASAAWIGRALAFDRDAADLDGIREAHLANARARDVHSSHAPGSEELAGRIAALRKTAIQPGEMPALLGTALDEHLAMAAEWRPIVACRDELARLAGNGRSGSGTWRSSCGTAAPSARSSWPAAGQSWNRRVTGDGKSGPGTRSCARARSWRRRRTSPRTSRTSPA